MVGLIEISPRTETVDVQGASVAVHGVSAKGVANLLGRFPELRMLMTGLCIRRCGIAKRQHAIVTKNLKKCYARIGTISP